MVNQQQQFKWKQSVMNGQETKDGEKSGKELLDESIKRFKEENRRTVKVEVRPGIVTITPPSSKS